MSPAAVEAGLRLGFDRMYLLRGEAAWRAGAADEALVPRREESRSRLAALLEAGD